jgi:multicomponent Na+:H+ antiporter subunit F
MIQETTGPLPFFALASITLLFLGMGLAVVRLFIGPSVPDRVAALDLAAMLTVGSIATYCVLTNNPLFLEVAIVLALISFLGTVAFAKYLEGRTW